MAVVAGVSGSGVPDFAGPIKCPHDWPKHRIRAVMSWPGRLSALFYFGDSVLLVRVRGYGWPIRRRAWWGWWLSTVGLDCGGARNTDIIG